MSTKRQPGFNQLTQRLSARAPKNPYHLPEKYQFLKVVGEGGFGKVLRCVNKETGNVVAIKMPKFKQCCKKEVATLKKLMCLRLDKHSIVKFHECFDVLRGEALVFESLELNLEDHIIKSHQPMLLSDISTIVKQVATALNALRSVGVIHTDIKPDNIMLVDQRRPFRVKLIDFGLAIDRSKARQGMTLQTVSFRSPEIILGLPFSEAIDMWSVGCLMFTMVFRKLLFEDVEYDTLRLMIDLLGQPPDELLNQGKWTNYFFIRTKSNSWRIKTPDEYWIKNLPQGDLWRQSFTCLDDLKKFAVKNRAEDAGLEQCIELMLAMLQMDQNERITPAEVLYHPFIYKKKKIRKRRRRKTVEKTINPAPTVPPSGVIPVCPPAAHDLQQSDRDDVKSGVETTTSTHPEHHSPPHTVLPSGLILVRPASPENTLQLEEEQASVSLRIEDGDCTEKKKKKKNCLQRFKSWFKRKFFCNQVGVL